MCCDQSETDVKESSNSTACVCWKCLAKSSAVLEWDRTQVGRFPFVKHHFQIGEKTSHENAIQALPFVLPSIRRLHVDVCTHEEQLLQLGEEALTGCCHQGGAACRTVVGVHCKHTGGIKTSHIVQQWIILQWREDKQHQGSVGSTAERQKIKATTQLLSQITFVFLMYFSKKTLNYLIINSIRFMT